MQSLLNTQLDSEKMGKAENKVFIDFTTLVLDVHTIMVHKYTCAYKSNAQNCVE